MVEAQAYADLKESFLRQWDADTGQVNVVFAQGKTGTSTIAAGLKRAGLHPVFQIHTLRRRMLDHVEAEYERRRGIETLFRVTYQNHISLSQLADQKAGILISINGLIISAIIAVVTPRFETWSWTLLPSLVLVAGCLVSLAFAILGARPRDDAVGQLRP